MLRADYAGDVKHQLQGVHEADTKVMPHVKPLF